MQYKIAVTGHREIQNPEIVKRALAQAAIELSDMEIVCISGAAEGADTLWAEVAHEMNWYLHVMYPNRYYHDIYPNSLHMADAIFGGSSNIVEITTVVDRPECDDWKERWYSERWWLDNLKRNEAMIREADELFIISPHHPLELVRQTKGGTAACLKSARKIKPDMAMTWIADSREIQINDFIWD